MRSEELLVDVEWEATLTQRSPTWWPDARGFERPEKTGVRLSLQTHCFESGPGLRVPLGKPLAIARVRRASSERALIALLTLVLAGTAAFLELRVFPELHALRAAASSRAPTPAHPPRQ